MTVEILREAAKVLRSQATAATPGAWTVAQRRDKSICGIDQKGDYGDVVTPGDVECMAYCYGGTSTVEAEDADWHYIAMMHPGVGLALADWLDTAGADLWAHGPLCECGSGCDDCDDDPWQPHVRNALAVARLISDGAS